MTKVLVLYHSSYGHIEPPGRRRGRATGRGRGDDQACAPRYGKDSGLTAVELGIFTFGADSGTPTQGFGSAPANGFAT